MTVLECREDLETPEHRARRLLASGEPDLPAGVWKALRFCRDLGLWYRLSRNAPAFSCRDAAHRRQRLGHTGISLGDEMKSLLMEVQDHRGERRLVMFHCRASDQIDMTKAAQAIPETGTITRFAGKALNGVPADYGLISPFSLHSDEHGRPLVHVFDPSVRLKELKRDQATVRLWRNVTGTLITNAGDHTWAIEFDPDQLIDRMAAHLPAGCLHVRDIIDTSVPPQAYGPRPIMILTGNSPASGMLLWKKINRRIPVLLGDAFRGDTSYPRVGILSIPEFGLSMEIADRHDHLLDVLMHEIDNLQDDLPWIVSVAAHSIQHFSPEISAACAKHGMTYIPMQDCLLKWVKREGITDALLLGLGHVVNPESKWNAYLDLLKSTGMKVLDSRIYDMISRIAYRVKTEGPDRHTNQQFREILRKSDFNGPVLLMLTELSEICDQFGLKKFYHSRIIDALDIYADEIVSTSLWQ